MGTPDYKNIGKKELEEMLDLPVSKLPVGLFLCWREVGGEDVWTAVKNTAGEARVESFTNKRAAVRWLHGHGVGKDQFWTEKDDFSLADRWERIISGI